MHDTEALLCISIPRSDTVPYFSILARWAQRIACSVSRRRLCNPLWCGRAGLWGACPFYDGCLVTMKGITKFLQRTPHMVSSRVGISAKSTDVEFDHFRHKFEAMEKLIKQLARESKTYLDGVKKMLESCSAFAAEYSALFHPFGTEYDIERRHPETVQTLVNLSGYVTYIDDLRETLRPELELIATRVVAPCQELEQVLKSINKAITKRDHKLIDFDRHTNSYTKLREKQNRSAKDDQHMFKLEHDCEAAAGEYEHHNNILKAELPQFLAMATKFVTPIFYSLYYMQLNVFYLSMEKLKSYSEGRFDMTNNNLISREHKFSMDMSKVIADLESFSIQKPGPPTTRILQMAKAGTPLSSRPRGLPSAAGSAAPLPPQEEIKKAEQVTAEAAATTESSAPPAYTPAPEEAAAPDAEYVVALYDYAATADGDLSFKAGDRIEVLKRTPSAEDWWTGRLNGVEGVFPGNYVRDA